MLTCHVVSIFERFGSLIDEDESGIEVITKSLVSLLISSCILEERDSKQQAAASVAAADDRDTQAPSNGSGSATVIDSSSSTEQAQVRLYTETELSRAVVFEGEPRLLRGTADFTLDYADDHGGRYRGNLVVVQSKRRYVLDSELGQMLAYMGELERRSFRWLSKVSAY